MNTTDQPITVLPFGKHRGEPLTSVPTPYLTWLLAKVKLSSGLRATVATELRARGEPVPDLPAPKPPRCRCGGTELRYQWRTRRDGQPQIARRCAKCNTHLGFAPQVEPYMSLARTAGSD